MIGEVDSWLDELDRTPTFYFDAITQLEMTSWSRGRVTLVGDAGYCPGPAVGGSTSLAVYGAYVLAGELARAGGDHAAAFAAYERTMMPSVLGSRKLARVNAKTIVPGSRWGVSALVGVARAGLGAAARCDAGRSPASTAEASGSTTRCPCPECRSRYPASRRKLP